MLQGSRHEKAAITAISYIIGFTAAYILFSNFSSTLNLPFATSTASQASVVVATESLTQNTEEVKVVEVAKSATSYSAGRLEVVVNDQVTLLSVNPKVSGMDLDTDELGQGFHFGELAYSANEDDKFVFFCEKHSAEADVCTGYVYDVDADRIYTVTKSAKAAVISEKSASEAIFTALGLKIGQNYSANKSAPWVLISGEDELDLE
jgi:hypothetical protein